MRKHFLILMLMALLPLAAFAEDIQPEWFSVLNVTYGTAAAPTKTSSAPATFVENTHYEVDSKFYKFSSGSYVQVTEEDLSASDNLKAGATYYVKISGKGDYSGVIFKSFDVNPKTVTVKFKGASWDFGTEKPADNVIYALDATTPFTGLVDGDYATTPTDLRKNVFKNAKYGTTGNESDVKSGGYAYSAESNDPNYTITVSDATKFVINPKNLPDVSATAYVFTTTTPTYNGAAVTGNNLPSFTITDGTLGTLKLNKDYTVEWYAAADASGSELTPLHAGTYYAQVVGKGNYSTTSKKNSAALDAAKQWKFTVAKKKATIYVKSMPGHTYNNVAIDVEPVVGTGNDINVVGSEPYVMIPNLETVDAALKDNIKVHFATTALNAVTRIADATEANTYNSTTNPNKANYLDASTWVATTTVLTGDDLTKFNNICGTTHTGSLTLTADDIIDYKVKYGWVVAGDAIAATASPVNAGSYGLMAYPITNPYTNVTGLGNDYDTADGYIEFGSYTIARRKVQVTAKNQTFTYNAKDQSTSLNTTASATTVDLAAVPEVANSGLVNPSNDAEKTTVYGLFDIALKSGVKIQDVTNAAYTGAIQIVAKTAEATSNYQIVPVAGNVKVNGKKLYVMAPVIDDQQYGYTLKATDLKPWLNVEGVTLIGTPVFTVKSTTNPLDTKNYQVGDLMPVGSYSIVLDETSVSAPTNYEIDRFEPGSINIEKKNLTITLDDVSLNAGDGVTELNHYATVADYETVNNEKIGFEFIFNAGLTGLLTAGGKLKTAAEYTTAAPAYWTAGTAILALAADAKLVASTTAAPNQNDNYEITFVKSNIILGGAKTLKLDFANAKIYERISDAAASEDTYTVTFSSRKMLEKNWYAMVLPFKTDPAELVQKFGKYVVVNVLDLAKTKKDGNVYNIKFKLTMDEIPAGVPFLIKPAAEVNWKDADAFTTKAIVGAPVGQGTLDANDVIFTGTFNQGKSLHWGYDLDGNKEEGYNPTDDPDFDDYETATLRYKWLSDMDYVASTKANDWRRPKKNAHNLLPLEAYLQLSATSSAARILVEDLENGTTAIKELGVDGTAKAYAVDGWYTLNGVKLQGAPTQKGIYINNGKKVVVK